MNFPCVEKLPEYVFNQVIALKTNAQEAGEDIIDFGMGNPDGPPPAHTVKKLNEEIKKTGNHGYSISRGIPPLRQAICEWYRQRYQVDLDPETEAVACMGVNEGLSHLVLAISKPDELVPSPTYPIHQYSAALKVMALAAEHDLLMIHDFAYADLAFDGYRPPSILQVPGAKARAVEMFSISKSYNLAGWRLGFLVGNSAAQRHDVRLGTDAGEISKDGIVGVLKISFNRGKSGGSPGVGFGPFGEGYVRFALIENEERTVQAISRVL